MTADEIMRGAGIGDPPDSEPARLVFYSPDDLLDSTPEEPDWVMDGYAGAGIITLLAGPPKRAGGKSTLAWALVRAMLEGHESFVGRRLMPGPVVYLSEEPAQLLRPKVEALRGLALRLIWRETAPRPKPAWAESIMQAADECERIGARLLIVDTFAEWALMRADAEKDAGAVQHAMAALAEAAARGLAVVLIHHHRKGGGEDGEAIRGSSALLGAVDIAIDLTRMPGDEGSAATNRQRMLNASSRWPDTPESMVIELRSDGATYTLVSEGERYEVRRQAAAAPLLAALPTDGEGLTSAELAAEMGVSAGRIRQELPALVAAGKVQREGRGQKGNPFRFLLANAASGALAASSSTDDLLLAIPPVGGASRKAEPVSDSAASRNGEAEDWRELLPEGVVLPFERPDDPAGGTA